MSVVRAPGSSRPINAGGSQKASPKHHHDVALAPRYFVQVIFNELQPHSHYVAGEEAEPGHIWIRADIRGGRTQEQKGRLMTRIVDEVCAISGASRESVWRQYFTYPGYKRRGVWSHLPQPGEEDAWFAKLPHDLQERLRSRA